jgi:hypothetical protein
MTDPFGPQYPPVLLAATRLLGSVMRCCWPRVPKYCDDIVKILMLCWLNIEEDEDPAPAGDIKKDQLKSELTNAASMLYAVMDTEASTLSGRTAPLIEQQPLLKGLFQPAAAGA